MKNVTKEELSRVMSELGKLSQKKSPKTKEDFQAMARKRWSKSKIKN